MGDTLQSTASKNLVSKGSSDRSEMNPRSGTPCRRDHGQNNRLNSFEGKYWSMCVSSVETGPILADILDAVRPSCNAGLLGQVLLHHECSTNHISTAATDIKRYNGPTPGVFAVMPPRKSQTSTTTTKRKHPPLPQDQAKRHPKHILAYMSSSDDNNIDFASRTS